MRLKTLGGEDILLDTSKPRDEIVSLFFPGIKNVPWDLEFGKGFYLTLAFPGYPIYNRLRGILGRRDTEMEIRTFRGDEYTVTFESPGCTKEIFRELRGKGIRMKFWIGKNTYMIR